MENSKFYKGFEYYKKGSKYIVRICGEYVGEYKTAKEIKERIDNQTIWKEINKMKILKNISFTILKIVFAVSVLMTFGNVTIFDLF